MPTVTKATFSGRRRVLFMSNVRKRNISAGRRPDQDLDVNMSLPINSTIQELRHLQGDVEDTSVANANMATDLNRPLVPTLFTSVPPIQDHLDTETSLAQDETIQECLPFLTGTRERRKSFSGFNADGLPRLEREKHIEFLRDSLEEMPSMFVAYDASRPWIVYWTLTGLTLLGADISQYRQRYRYQTRSGYIVVG